MIELLAPPGPPTLEHGAARRRGRVTEAADEAVLTVSALICTAGRGDSLVRTVRSILHSASICMELLIVDQSDDDATETALRPFAGDERLRYIRLRSKGKGHALNVGLAQARGDIVAITDDDCEVDPTWPRFHHQAMTRHPKVAVSFGNVFAVPYERKAGFIPDYIIPKDRLCRNLRDKLPARGIGANMAVRRLTALRLGGFDPALGPGGRFRACVDGDMTVRALLAGHHVYESACSKVLHYGFRDWEQGRRATRNAWTGIGAAYAKPLRAGHWEALPLPMYEFFVHAFFPLLGAALGLRPSGWARVSCFLTGFFQGWRAPMDRQYLLYLEPGDQG